MRKALVVGIDHYPSIVSLKGAVNDARAVAAVLERHGDAERGVNFDVEQLTSASLAQTVERIRLKDAIRRLFLSGQSEIALLYFAGHGYIDETGGYICAGDSRSGDDGIPLGDIMTMANQSKASSRIVVLDSCHSGAAANHPLRGDTAEIGDGVTILAASAPAEEAREADRGGVFTGLFVDALEGAAANLIGDVSPGSVYAHIDQSLGSWVQRPTFKTNVSRFVSLRRVAPAVALGELRLLAKLFPAPGHRLPLDPSYEPERAGGGEPELPPPDPANTATFAILQKFNRVGLLVPEGAPHLWHAAMARKSVRLTPLGEHYRRLAATKRF